ncbi:MAG: CDP-glycerol glycerophosphotransferase family protein [Natronohydrobacter sp.]|nr:CDP-glycerol glycerophosphotransferase family protein [Natronohydrobacter sp.]
MTLEQFSRILTAQFWRCLGLIMPRQRNAVVLIPRKRTGFSGNVKYLFLAMQRAHQTGQTPLRPTYLTPDPALAQTLSEAGLPVVLFPSWRAMWALLRCRFLVVEDTLWSQRMEGRNLAAIRAFRFQLWHGNGIKTIGWENPKVVNAQQENPYVSRLLDWHPRYDAVCFASETQLRERRSAFRFRAPFLNGQPRNDSLFAPPDPLVLLGSDTDAMARIEAAVAQGKRLFLYAPTWRPRDMTQPFEALDTDRIAAFLKQANAVLVYKPHPKESGTPKMKGIIRFRKSADIYPALRHFDALITDYSSIFSDFLLLDRPIIFYTYDRQQYEANRKFMHEFDRLVPGPIVDSTEALLAGMRRVVEGGEDIWSEKRALSLDLLDAFRDDKSCKRAITYLEEHR